MFGDQPRCMCVVLEHTRKIQVRPAEAEIDGRFLGVRDKFREIIASSQPREDAIAFPSPGNDFFASEVGGEMPARFLGESFNATMNAVVVPPERDQYSLSALLHCTRQHELHAWIFQLF